MNFENLIDALTCPLSIGTKKHAYTRHFFEDPKIFPCCNRTACNRCILRHLTTKRNSPDFFLNCPFCELVSRVIVVGDECKLDTNIMAASQLERNLMDINHYLLKKLENSVNNIEERFDCKENFLNKRKELIENEIHDQIANLKNHLDQVELELKSNLNQSVHNMKSNLEKFEQDHKPELKEIKSSIETLRANSLSYVNSDVKLKSSKAHQSIQFKTVDSCILHLNELGRINNNFSDMISELKFDPNVDLPPKSIIGKLKQINNVDLAEQFKTIQSHTQITKIQSVPGSKIKVPISPKYACISDSQTLLFTDSQSRHLIEINLITGDFVRSTNLNGILKNPDGICVNPKKSHIYLTDSELKFGVKDLKWPKGIYYDYESKHLSDNASPDRLYVCDYSGERVAVYNEHEQLRDYLVIPYLESPTSPTFAPPESFAFKGHRNSVTSDEDYKFCPLNVKVNRNFIFVTDDWTGENCIRVFDRQTHHFLRNIGDLNVWNPLGLILDDAANLFTTARLYYETGQTNLFCFNTRTNELQYKTCLNVNSDCVTDLILDRYTDRRNQKFILKHIYKLIEFKKSHVEEEESVSNGATLELNYHGIGATETKSWNQCKY
ncbi:hypothetical protein BpHYR1_054027 [Brachionus plicatilis]|uniref:Uncharacterized protein n=1 Tax=Brachionus plicatilis TaxID=10195 RepID=A0A3M7QGA4_BRAPC|nr:hypothetical protein BpHYR1_054027 [Brachionus plicatilis]